MFIASSLVVSSTDAAVSMPARSSTRRSAASPANEAVTARVWGVG
jgi:hypothetical protein